MAAKPLLVNMGLVTSKDPAMLAEGEVMQADDAYYRPNDPALWKVKGRQAFNATAEASAITGIRWLQFDGATDLFLARHTTVLRSATAAKTGSFADVATGLTATTYSMDTVHYNNVHYTLDGVNRNRAISSSGTASLHGMLANTTAPSVASTGAGTGFTLSSGATISYWVEERVKSGSTITKRNGETGDTIVTLVGTGALVKPVVTRPATVNSDATHWALYATETNGSWPTGAEIAEVVIGTTTIEDTRTGTDPAISTGDTYEVLSVEIAGVTQNSARNGPPPIATTGDILEDSLVLNDVSDLSLVRYSFPDTPHAFPSVNYVRFETKDADQITLIKSLGACVIVCMRDSVYRLETLPRPDDASFQIERVKAQIHGALGCVGNKAGAVFSFGEGPKLAYVSSAGVIVTDGYTWDILSDDVDWEGTVNISALSGAVLIYDPNDYILKLFYPASNSATNNKALYFHVHPSHLKETPYGLRAKVTGPVNVKARDACVATIGGARVLFTAHTSDGVLYQERIGNADDSGAGGIAYAIKTGDVYLSGVGGEEKNVRYWVHHRASPGQTATATLTSRNEGESDVAASEPISLTRREATAAYHQGQGEAFQFGVSNSDSLGQIAINGFFVDDVSLGTAQA